MADSKITDLAAYTTVHADDLLVGVDVHDTSMAPSGTDKRLTTAQLFAALTGPVTYSGFAGTLGTGVVATANLAAGAVTAAKMAAGAANSLAGYDNAGAFAGVAVGPGLSLSGGTLAATGGGGSGTVTSVAMTVPSILSVSGSPITTSGTLAVSLASESANLVLAGPSTGAATAPTFRALVAADFGAGVVPNAALANSSVTISGHALALGGTLSLAAGDVGLGSVTNDAQTKASLVPNTAPSAGQILAGNAGGTAYAPVSVSGSGATVSLASTGVLTISAVANAALANSSVTVTAGTGLSGGGPAALGGSTTLSIAAGGVGTTQLAAGAVTAAKIANGTANALMGFDGSGVATTIAAGSGIAISGGTISATTGGGGTVTSVSVASANGFAGTVATATTTPAITLSTTVTGLLKGDGTAISAAVAGTDYLAGNQTITLSGAVSGSGTTGITTFLANIANNRILANTSGSSAAPIANTLSGIIDSCIGNTQGNLLYRGASLWSVLAPGTSGQVLTSGGAAANPSWTTVGGAGTVTSVALTVPSWLSVSGSPVTTSGTLAVSAAGSQTANQFLATPNGVPGAVGLRAIVAADVPTLNQNTTGTAANVTGVVAAANGGTGQSSYATGDMLYAGGATAVSKLGGNTSTTKNFLTSTGTGSGANAPSWGTIAAVDVPAMVASGASHAAGICPDPGSTAGTTRFLREDATWAVPAGGGGSPGGSSTQVQYNSSGAFAGAANLTVGSSGQLNFASQSAPGSPANGDVWHDSTQHALAYRQGGLTVFRPGVVYTQTANVSYATTAGSASLVSTTGAVGTVSLPAGALNVAGRTLRVRARGYLATPGTGPGTISMSVYLGATAVVTGPAIGLTVNDTSRPWSLDVEITVKATGVSGTLDGSGILLVQVGAGNANAFPLQNSNAGTAGSVLPGTPLTLDLTAAYTFDLQVTLSAAVNTIVLTNLTVEVLG